MILHALTAPWSHAGQVSGPHALTYGTLKFYVCHHFKCLRHYKRNIAADSRTCALFCTQHNVLLQNWPKCLCPVAYCLYVYILSLSFCFSYKWGQILLCPRPRSPPVMGLTQENSHELHGDICNTDLCYSCYSCCLQLYLM